MLKARFIRIGMCQYFDTGLSPASFAIFCASNKGLRQLDKFNKGLTQV
jgi:hypothetical protein